MTSRVALDIETISPTVPDGSYPDFDDPDDFELLGVALAPEPGAGADPVFHLRAGSDPASELALVETVVATLREWEADELVTYNGEDFDLPMLRGRTIRAAEAASTEFPARHPAFTALADALRGVEHTDLLPPAWAAYGDYTRLETLCEREGCPPTPTYFDAFAHGLDTERLRLKNGETVTGADVALIGERYLAALDGEPHSLDIDGTRSLLEHYALGDIEHLFALADARPFGERT